MSAPGTPWPAGLGVRLDPATTILRSGEVLFGGQEGRAVRLSEVGAAVVADLFSRASSCDGRTAVATDDDPPAARSLLRRLVVAGLAHPTAPIMDDAADRLTVVVPVKERAAELERCLTALHGHQVVVVDDGSDAAAAIAEVCRRHRARLIRLSDNYGPAAARNAGLAVVQTPLVAFVDSDVEVGVGWSARLVGHFEDPALALVAPRMVAALPETGSVLSRYSAARFALDMGTEPATVTPYGRVGYLPSATMVARVDALADIPVGPGGGPFDPLLRCGEDVDLVWRLLDAGHVVRYDPAVRCEHNEPPTWSGILRRRRIYGTSVAPLAERHPEHVAHLRASPVAATAVGALALGRPVVGAAVALMSILRLGRRLHPLGITRGQAATLVGRSIVGGAVGLMRAATMLGWPALAALAGTSWRRRIGVGLVVLGPPLLEWVERRPAVDPIRWTIASMADDLAYGSGVVSSSWRLRTARAFLPRLSGRRRTTSRT